MLKMKLSQCCQALVWGFPKHVTVPGSSQLEFENLEALCIVLHPLLSYVHWGTVQSCVFPEWNSHRRELSLGGGFFFLQSHSYSVLGEEGTKTRTSNFLSPSTSRSFLGYRWERQLVFRSKLTMHTAFDRKDNAHPAEITALGISKWVAHQRLLKTLFSLLSVGSSRNQLLLFA